MNNKKGNFCSAKILLIINHSSLIIMATSIARSVIAVEERCVAVKLDREVVWSDHK